MMTDKSQLPHSEHSIPQDGLTEEERAKLLEGIHVLIDQVPELRGYKFKKNTSLKDYASHLKTREARDAFIDSFGDISLPFSLEVSDSGKFYRVLPHEFFLSTGIHARVKCAIDLEIGPTLLFARKTSVPPLSQDNEVQRDFQLDCIKKEAGNIPRLFPGGRSDVASPYWLGPDNQGRRSSEFTKKCPEMPEKRQKKVSLYMPFGPGKDLFDWTESSAREPRFKKYTPEILAATIIAVENFRLQEVHKAEEMVREGVYKSLPEAVEKLMLVHNDLKLENFMCHLSKTDPVDIVIKLVDPADIARVSEGRMEKMAGTSGYIGREIYSAWRNGKLPIISPKTDSFALGVTLLQLCFTNFYELLVGEQEQDYNNLIRDCVSYNRRMKFVDEREEVYGRVPGSRNEWILLEPTLPKDSPDCRSLYQEVKFIAKVLLDDDPNKRGLGIDVLRVFRPEVEYLVDRNPELKDTPAIQALFGIRPAIEPEIQRKLKPH